MFSDAYVTVMVSNMKRSIDFYKKLGMKVRFKSEYWDEVSGPGIWIGLHLSDKKPSGTTSIGLVTKDIEKEIAALKKKGIKVAPVDEEDYGRFAYFSDPDGNEMHLFEDI